MHSHRNGRSVWTFDYLKSDLVCCVSGEYRQKGWVTSRMSPGTFPSHIWPPLHSRSDPKEGESLGWVINSGEWPKTLAYSSLNAGFRKNYRSLFVPLRSTCHQNPTFPRISIKEPPRCARIATHWILGLKRKRANTAAERFLKLQTALNIRRSIRRTTLFWGFVRDLLRYNEKS